MKENLNQCSFQGGLMARLYFLRVFRRDHTSVVSNARPHPELKGQETEQRRAF